MGVLLTQVLLPNGMQTFIDENGKPLTGGKVYYYEPGTTTDKTTWLDIDLTVPNDNPIPLDAAGRCIAWGDGIYRQVVYDALGNLQWDQLTSTGFNPQDEPTINVAYDKDIFWQGVPSDGEVYPIINIVRNVLLPIGLAGSIFTCGVNPTGTAVMTIKKNNVAIGTVTFSTLGIATVNFPAEIAFVPGDQISVTNQSPTDATMAAIAWTLVFTLVP